MSADKLRPTAADPAQVQAQAGADHLAELATKAAQAAAMAADDVREAHRAACNTPGEDALALLLQDAIGEARRLADRLALVAGFAGTNRQS